MKLADYGIEANQEKVDRLSEEIVALRKHVVILESHLYLFVRCPAHPEGRRCIFAEGHDGQHAISENPYGNVH